MRAENRDRGQGGILLLIVTAVLLASVSAALVVVGGRMIDRTQAQNAADAAALGSVVEDAPLPKPWQNDTAPPWFRSVVVRASDVSRSWCACERRPPPPLQPTTRDGT